jgi:hypothetical protein
MLGDYWAIKEGHGVGHEGPGVGRWARAMLCSWTPILPAFRGR